MGHRDRFAVADPFGRDLGTELADPFRFQTGPHVLEQFGPRLDVLPQSEQEFFELS